MKVKEENYTKRQREFIGTVFETKAGILSVVSVHKVDGCVKYGINCSICSKDQEVFPLILASKRHLTEGKIPCRCSKRFKPNEYQLNVLVCRELKRLGYKDTPEIVDGFKGKENTQFIVKDPLTGKDKQLSSKVILSGNLVPPKDKQKVLSHSSDSFIDKVLKYYPIGVSIVKDTVSENLKGERVFYKYTCPICLDIYGLKDFTVRSSTLCVGGVPCYCNPSKIKNILMLEEQCKLLCDKYSGTFKSITEDREYVSWLCSKGHHVNTYLQNFLHKGTQCKLCRDVDGNCYIGYYRNLKDKEDYLYLLLLEDPSSNEILIKIGRSFNVNRRKSCIPYNTTLISSVKGTHENIFKLEQELLYSTLDSKVTPLRRFKGDGECRDYNLLAYLQERFTNI